MQKVNLAKKPSIFFFFFFNNHLKKTPCMLVDLMNQGLFLIGHKELKKPDSVMGEHQTAK